MEHGRSTASGVGGDARTATAGQDGRLYAVLVTGRNTPGLQAGDVLIMRATTVGGKRAIHTLYLIRTV